MIHGIEGDGKDYTFSSNDLKVDIAIDDEESKILCLAHRFGKRFRDLGCGISVRSER